MNGNLRGAMFSFILLGLVLLGFYLLPDRFLPPKPTEPPVPPTARPEDTLTPTSTNTIFVAHVNIDSPCRAGTHEDADEVAMIPQGKTVMAIGKDSAEADWLLVRWFGVADCWIETKYVTSPDIGFLETVDTPQPFTFTPVTMPTSDSTETPVPTKTARVTLTPSRTRRPHGSVTPVPPRTNTPRPVTIPPRDPTRTPSSPPPTTSVSSTKTAVEPTRTPAPIVNTPVPPTNTPVPPTADYPRRECNDGVDNDDDGRTDTDDPDCRNRGDDSES